MSTTHLAQTPAASSPPGVTSDLLHPPTKNILPGVVAAIIGMFIAAIFLTIRIYTKVFLARRFGFDDVALLLSKALSVVVQVLIVYLKMQKIEGVHVWDLSVPNFKTMGLFTGVSVILYVWTTALAKVSILMLYLRISPEKWFIFSIYATITFVTSFATAATAALIFACLPLERVWDPTVTYGHCINRGKVYLSMAGMNAATDIIILVLPMPLLNRLNLAFRQKVGVMLIFGVGSLYVCTSTLPRYAWNLGLPLCFTAAR
ncbi:hypothetical protein CB0940_05648 [Cercospora beticola]|uniref:Rhodopsin domain-containing protein n=1 Tax=Cercospora beticola TaxID=122368 RepID=A0A2G5I0T7_CERBT|nr:hypothetical protein CB0940_05648 [Cercospora beticola]PIA98112.1 hypothetical protein CB0940_05648 [Cercospora beticola]